MTVLRRMIVLPQCERIVMNFAEAGLQNPLDSIYKLSKIATRASTEDNLVWVMQLMYDMWSSGALHNDQFAVRNLGSPGGKSLVDLLVFKTDILEHLLHKFMDSRSFLEPVKKTIRDACANIDTFRKHCGYFYNTKHNPAPLLDFILCRQVSFQLASQGFSGFH